MNRSITAVISALLIGLVLVGCEDDPIVQDDEHPLTGVYTLTEMTISVEATTVGSNTLAFAIPQAGEDSVTIEPGTLILTEFDLYTDEDTDPIGGTVTLRSDLSGTLAGNLPVNWGTGCAPSILISGLSSDGVWSADTSSGVFTLDLVVDQLDIDGFFTLNGNALEVVYDSSMPGDERVISSVSHLGAEVAVVPVCLPVATVTRRVLSLTLN